MSQEKLGKAVSLTFQQIQKYERGANRIGSSRLYQLANILDVPVSFFFDGVEERLAREGNGVQEGQQEAYESDQLSRRETLELVRAYYRITDPAVRKKIFDLVKAVSSPAKSTSV
ncbi:MAG: helix-turn-helix transcriptional regulator [Rhodospirillales bacterium]|nr:helix-turn-helix transcriptional regulator [Rhodospirillales bacterium]